MKARRDCLTQSGEMKREYCAKVIRLGTLRPVEGADRLVQTMVDGNSVVLPRGVYETGQAVIYCMHETEINRDFLAANNLYCWSERGRNTNRHEVETLVVEGKEEEARRMVGFFGRNGRVRTIRLRGCPSYGCIFGAEHLVRWLPELEGLDLGLFASETDTTLPRQRLFDTVAGHLFAQAYVPHGGRVRRKKKKKRSGAHRKRGVDRMVPGQFEYHYDTELLGSGIWRLQPKTVVDISVKLHGSSVIIANVLTQIPVHLGIAQRIANSRTRRRLSQAQRAEGRFGWQRELNQRICKQAEAAIYPTQRVGYGMIYSSRRVIKNRYINPRGEGSFYGVDIWTEYGQLMRPYIPEGMTLYGEICGYVSGTSDLIQSGYDYGCAPGENFLTPYRITYTDQRGHHSERNIGEVIAWTARLLDANPTLQGRVRILPMLYHGTLRDLYPHIDTRTEWHEQVLQAMKNDGSHFGLEQAEPLCHNIVPREGICLRIQGDTRAECFKLKSLAFLNHESKLIDQGLVDTEQVQNSHTR